jgi:DNA-binding NtrC family response regulator
LLRRFSSFRFVPVPRKRKLAILTMECCGFSAYYQLCLCFPPINTELSMAQDQKLIPNSTFAKRITKQIQKLVQGKEDIIVQGEAGSGRKTIAQEIHSERGKKRPIVILECLTATDGEARAIIAGGDAAAAEATTGRRITPLADAATLVVADLESLAPHNQMLLASFLKEGRKKFPAVKVIVTLSESLIRLAQGGGIIPELMSHLEKFETIEIPALRDRLEDIPALVASMTKYYCASFGRPAKEIDENTYHILSQGQWPGNVRQLAAVVGKAVLISHGDRLELPAEFLDERQHLTDAVPEKVRPPQHPAEGLTGSHARPQRTQCRSHSHGTGIVLTGNLQGSSVWPLRPPG